MNSYVHELLCQNCAAIYGNTQCELLEMALILPMFCILHPFCYRTVSINTVLGSFSNLDDFVVEFASERSSCVVGVKCCNGRQHCVYV